MKKLLIFVLSTIMMTVYSGRNTTDTDEGAVTTKIEVTQTEDTSVETEITLDTTTESTDINTPQPDITTSAPDTTVTTKTTSKPAVTTKTTKTPSVTTCPVTTNKTAVTSRQTIPGTKTPTVTTGTSSPSQGSSAYVQEVVNLVNAERAKAGLSALTILPEAERAAQVRATEIITSFSHTRPNGASPFTALDEQGVKYKTCGENIAAGQRTPQDVMTSWMNSSGHRANILNASFKQIGVGYATGGSYGTNWVQMFVG